MGLTSPSHGKPPLQENDPFSNLFYCFSKPRIKSGGSNSTFPSIFSISSLINRKIHKIFQLIFEGQKKIINFMDITYTNKHKILILAAMPLASRDSVFKGIRRGQKTSLKQFQGLSKKIA